MSGGEIRVLRQEAGQESPRMPAWKREILERRKAKGGGAGAGAGAGAAEPCPSASSSRVNGEVTGNGSGSKKDNASCAAAGRTYTVSSASFTGTRGSSTVTSPELSPVKTNKDPWTDTDSAERTEREDGEHESLVLQDSLGPLQENPFIKLEKERKKRQDRENASRPVQHILELYGSVPGIRTIRAENIIIIESDPDYFSDTSGAKSSSTLQQNGVGNYSSLNDLMDRRGSAVTEIRANEVVIYDTALSRSEENLSTLGRPGYEGSLEPGDAQGMVSRMLQKFDSNYGKLQPKCRSTENLLDLETSVNRSRSRPKLQPDLVPKHSSSLPQPGSPVSSLVRPGWSSPVLQGPLAHRSQDSTGPSQPLSPSWSKPISGGGWETPESFSKPKVPCSPETLRPRAVPPSPASSTSPPSPTFQIRPAARPDLSQLPAGDIQARALANLRLQSRNSFTVIPKRHAASSSVAPGKTAPPSPASPLPPAGVPTPPSPMPTPELSSREEETIPVSPSPDLPPPASPTSPPPFSPPPEASSTEHLPITNIDDIDVEPGPPVGPPGPPYPSPMVQKRKGNTFTVVPKRKPQPPQPQVDPQPQTDPQSQADPQPQLASPQPQTDSQPQEDHSGGTTPASTPPPAPYAHLGSLLKKRYPAVEEIEVIGGYLSLGRSCLSKTSSMGKKLNISFNESSLQNTYEYPSESSMWDSGEEEEEGGEKGGGEKEEEPRSIVGRIHIPRPGFSSSPSHTPNSSDLSSYTPKHTVDFNTWQEHKLDDLAYQGDANSQRAQMSEDVMLTPADCSSLSDFSSEPALYF